MPGVLDMIQPESGPVYTLLVVRGYFIAFVMLSMMVVLHYRTRIRFKQWVFYIYGAATALFFLFPTALVTYNWFVPGIVFNISLSLVLVLIGLVTGWVIWGREEAFTKHERRYYPGEIDYEEQNSGQNGGIETDNPKH